jgi:HK97 family phage major capsid protein
MPPDISAVAALAWVARGKLIAKKSSYDEAQQVLTAHGVPARVKAAIGAGSLVDSTLGQYGVTIGQWSDSARTASAFYRMLADNAFVRVPFNSRPVGLVTSAPSAGVVAEGKAIAVSRVTLNNVILQPIKAAGLIVITDDLLLAVDAAAQSVFGRELLSVVAAAADTAFVDILDNGLTPITSTAALADLRAALLAVTSGSLQRLYWVASTDVGKLASTLGDTKGGPAFAAASAVGGELANLPLLVSSGVASGTLYLVDGAQIAANGEAPTIDISSQANIQMDAAPTMASDVPTATTTVSMFQTNSTALRSVAVLACQKLRNTAVAVVTGISASTWAA